MKLLKSKLLKSLKFSLDTSKYGLKATYYMNKINNLFFLNDFISHRDALNSYLNNEMKENYKKIIDVILYAKKNNELNLFMPYLESCKLELLKFLIIYSTFYGSLVSAERIRTVFLLRLIQEKSSHPLFLYDVALAYLEIGEIEKALELSLSGRNSIFKNEMHEINFFCNYLLGNESSYLQYIFNHKKSNRHLNFNLPLSFSTVLIKGPSNNKKITFRNYDYIVKTNFISNENKDISNHILYYNYRRFEKYSSEIKDLSEKASYICLKSDSQFKKIKNNNLRNNIRTFSNSRPIFFRLGGSDPMAIQNITYDLIKSGVANMFIESIDGYSTSKSYSKSYVQSELNNKKIYEIKNVARALRIHDPFSNFSYIKNILNSRRVKGDDIFCKVFSMNRSSYAERINSIYEGMYVSS